jgi:hypothetical protein
MRKTILLATTMGAALLVAVPVMAQTRDSAGAGYGFTPPPGTPVTPDNQGGAGLIPPVGQQYGAARRVQSADVPREIGPLLRQAEMALSRGNAGVANEYLERAETTLLNRQSVAGPGPQASRLHGQINEARQALMNRDRAEALRDIRMAMGMVNEGGTATGGDTGMDRGRPGPAGAGSAQQWPGVGGPVGDYSGRYYESPPGTRLQTPAYPSQQSGPAAGVR